MNKRVLEFLIERPEEKLVFSNCVVMPTNVVVVTSIADIPTSIGDISNPIFLYLEDRPSLANADEYDAWGARYLEAEKIIKDRFEGAAVSFIDTDMLIEEYSE